MARMAVVDRLDQGAKPWGLIRWSGFCALVAVQTFLGMVLALLAGPFELICPDAAISAPELQAWRWKTALLVVSLLAFWLVWLFKARYRGRAVVAAVIVLAIPISDLIHAVLSSPHAAGPCNIW